MMRVGFSHGEKKKKKKLRKMVSKERNVRMGKKTKKYKKNFLFFFKIKVIDWLIENKRKKRKSKGLDLK